MRTVKKSWLRVSFAAVLSVAISVSTVGGSALASAAYADDAVVYPNSTTLDSLRTDRSYIVDALNVGIRPSDDWGGAAFTGNPHLAGANIDHYMYEDLIDQYETDPKLKAIVELYKAKSDWENYPLETIAKTLTSPSTYMPFLAKLNATDTYSGQNKAMREAYVALGGTFPTEQVTKLVEDKIANDEDWAGYSVATLERLSDGSAEYEAYKETLENSSDDRDKQVYNWLVQEEQNSYSTSREAIQTLSDTIESVQGAMGVVNGEQTKGAKIYDAILNDIFTADYTSSAGVALHKDFEAKTELDECAKVIKNYKKALGHVSEAVDLAENNAQKVLVDDYLDILKDMSERKTENLTAALKRMDQESGWYEAPNGTLTEEFIAYYYDTVDMDADEAAAAQLADVKAECEESYFMLDNASSYISMVKKYLGWSKSTIANYRLLDALARENEYIRGVLERSTDTTASDSDESWKIAAEKYCKMLDVTDGSNTENQMVLAVFKTASEELAKSIEKKGSKAVKKFAREQLVSLGKDAATRASIATTLSKISTVYTIVDTLDDYVAGLQDAAEKVYEILYLDDVQRYAYAAYLKDCAAYDAEDEPSAKDEIAADALADLQFLKQIKLREIDAAHDTLSAFKDDTLSGAVAKLLAGSGADSLDDLYQKQMDAVLHMMVCPVGGTPYSIPNGKTLTLEKVNSITSRDTYVGRLTDSDDKDAGAIYEMEYLAAGGIDVPNGSTLIVDCDMSLPQIVGDGGSLVVKDRRSPRIGYVNGNLTCCGNVHVKGSVNGSIVPGNDYTDIEVDGNMESSVYQANAWSYDAHPSILVHGDMTVEQKLGLYDLDLTVEGTCEVATEQRDGNWGNDFEMRGATLNAKGDFAYYGTDSMIEKSNSGKGSEIRVWKDARFMGRDENDYIRFDKSSTLVMCGDGTASLHGAMTLDGAVIHPLRIANAGDHSWYANLTFDTKSIKALDRVYFDDYTFPEGLHVADDSVFDNVRSTVNMNGLTFDKGLEFPDGALYYANGELRVNGTTTMTNADFRPYGTLVTQGDVYVDKDTLVEFRESSPVVIGGDLYFDSAKSNSLYGTVKGNLHIGEGATFSWVDVVVEGDLVHRGASSGAGYGNSNTCNIEVKGDVDLKVAPQEGEETASVQGIRLSGGTAQKPQVVTVDPSNTFDYLHFDNAVARFPNGLEFKKLGADYDDDADRERNVDNTLTIVDELPYFRGGKQESGTVVFADDVASFSMVDDRVSYGDNILNSIHAKKDVKLTADLDLNGEKSISYRDPLGRFKVDGTLSVPDGVSFTVRRTAQPGDSDPIAAATQTTDFGGTLKVEEGGYAAISTNAFYVHGIEVAGEEAWLNLDLDEDSIMYWSGGNFIFNTGKWFRNKVVLDSDGSMPTLGVLKNDRDAEYTFKDLDIVSVPGIRLEAPVRVDEMTCAQEALTIMGHGSLGLWGVKHNDQGFPKAIHYRGATGLEDMTSMDGMLAIWDVTSVEYDEETGVCTYDADLTFDNSGLSEEQLAEARAGAVKVCYLIDAWSETRYYQKGSKLILDTYTERIGEDDDATFVRTVLPTMYTDYAGTKPFDLLAETAQNDLVLGYKPDSMFEDRFDASDEPGPDDPRPQTFSMDDVTVPYLDDVTYDGTAHKPKLALSFEDSDLVEGTDYTVEYQNNVEVGTATVVITGKGRFKGTVERTFEIVAQDGSDEPDDPDKPLGPSSSSVAIWDVVLPQLPGVVYTGKPITPAVKLVFEGSTLEEGVDYTLDYANNVNAGAAVVVVSGKGRFTDSVELPFTIKPKAVKVQVSAKQLTWTGKALSAKLTVKANGETLKAGEYAVSYSGSRKAVGTCRAKVTLKGNYAGSAAASFDIVPKGTSVKRRKPLKKALSVTVAKQAKEVTGYEVQASLKKNFSGAKKAVTKKASKTTVKLSKLKAKKKYFVRARTYKTVKGKKYYSAWSKTVSAKTK